MSRRLVGTIFSLLVVVCVAGNTALGQFSPNSDPSLVGWWTFDDGDGTVAADSSPNGNDGEVINGGTWITGQMGGALELDGDNDYVQLDIGDLVPTLQECTFCIWVNWRGGNAWQRFIDIGTGTANYIYFVPGDNNGLLHIAIVAGNGNWNDLITDNGLPTDEWTHVAVTVSDSEAAMNAYVDGESVGTYTNMVNSVDDLGVTTNNWVGRSQYTADAYFNGSVDDFRIYNKILSEEEITRVLLGINEAASSPKPDNGASEVRRDAVMTWQPGEDSISHDVYFGTSFEDVNTATRTDQKDVLLSQGQGDAGFDPEGLLPYDSTLYWRIDEIQAGDVIIPGSVWSFTTEAYSYVVPDVNVTASAPSMEGADPINLVNDPSAAGTSTADGTMWNANPGDANEILLDFDLGAVYRLDEMRVWNFNLTLEGLGYLNFSVKDIAVESSIDGETWTPSGDHTLTQGTGTVDNPGQVIKLEDTAAQYVRLIAKSTYGGVNFGLSEVHFYYIPTRASEPEPASGAADLDPAVTLSWRSGREAASHRVYLDTDPNAVADETTSFTTSNTNMLDLGVLDLGQTYYWMVSEVNEAEEPAAWSSDVWDFSTTEYFSVDDFESYTDEPGGEVFNVWADGYGIGDNGSQVTYDNPPYMESTTVHSGEQAMPYYYGKSGAANSEATMDVGGANWTVGNAKTLVLYFHGDADNSPAQLYVKIGTTRIDYPGDSAGLAAPLWKQWNIDLTGISVSRVTSLTIGVDGPGEGLLFIDDIRLYREATAMPDPAVDPGTANLKAYYPMSGNVADTSGNNRDGTVGGAGTGFGDGPTGYGQALTLDGSSTAYATIPVGPVVQASDSMTVAAWVSRASTGANQRVFDFGNDTTVYMFMAPSSGGGVRFAITTSSNSGESEVVSEDPLPADGSWHHVAITIDADAAELNLYVDGALADTAATETLPSGLGNTANNWISRSQWTADPYMEGAIDEFRIYDRALSDAEVRYLVGDR